MTPTWPSSSPMACCCRSRFWRRRATAASTCTAQRCRAGGVQRRSSAPSWPAIATRRRDGDAHGRRSRHRPDLPAPSAIAIAPDMTAGELHDQMMVRGASLMVRALAALERGSLHRDTAAGRRRHLRRQDRQGRDTHRFLAAGQRGPRSHSRAVAVSRRLARGGTGRKARAHQGAARGSRRRSGEACGTARPSGPVIACGKGAIRLVEVQRAGRKPMSGAELMRGFDLGEIS